MRKRISELRGLGWFICAFLGLAAGVALFTPWQSIWTRALISVDEQAANVRLSWQSIDRAGLSGFRVVGLNVGLVQSPGELRFNHADVRVGLNEWNVRLDTGGAECFLTLEQNGQVSFEGDMNLSYLLSDDLKGQVRVAGNIRRGGGSKPSGWVDLRTQAVNVGGRAYGDVAFMGEFEGRMMQIREFSLGEPVSIRAEGTALVDPADIPGTIFQVEGTRKTPDGDESFLTESSLRSLFDMK